MNYKRYITTVFFSLLIFSSRIIAQHNINLSISFTQIKDEYNAGMVFSGPGISLNYGYWEINSQRSIFYQFGIGADVLSSRGIAGFSFNIKPIDVFYGWNIIEGDTRLYLGPRIATNYRLQLYPDLQSGLDFWFTSFDLSPNIIFEIPKNDDLIRVQSSVSLIGITSRTPSNIDPHFFSLQFSDFISDLHSDMRFGSYNDFLNITGSLEYLFGKSKSWSLAYNINYSDYFKEPTIESLNHSLNVKYNFGE